MPDHERFQRLTTITVRLPEGPLLRDAITQAALVTAHTPTTSWETDKRRAQIIARVLYEDAIVDGVVDEQRALTRASIDHWLSTSESFSPRSLSEYRAALYHAGRAVYPREFPAARVVYGTKGKATPPAKRGEADEVYSIVSQIPQILRERLYLVLDLISGAGLTAHEIRELTGADISVVPMKNRQMVVVRVRHRGKVQRRVPVVNARKGRSILHAAQKVGKGFMYPPTVHGEVSRSAVSRLNDRLREYGYQGINACALRNRWILDMAQTPGIPAAALVQLAGPGALKVLNDQRDLLPTYSVEELSTILLDVKGHFS
ncbi:hypothetical protein [Corynebacterium dentalis]|uniref:hypothetical protein n=1 Tax=Corynebacterium dentalis TaxID=2014528 RepID=UPI00289B0153|nr:hypothetical protein [Corynebacterium dentalis]